VADIMIKAASITTFITLPSGTAVAWSAGHRRRAQNELAYGGTAVDAAPRHNRFQGSLRLSQRNQ
jgi:hypothetical protein